MKKTAVFVVAILLILSASLFVGCANKETLTCYVPDGAPALAVANIIQSQKIGLRKVETTVTTGEEVLAKCQNGEADLAILPINAAVTVCSLRKEYCFFSINVKGLLYIVGTQQVETLDQLKCETVHSIGLGNTPEFVFTTILDKKNIDHTTANGIDLQYATDASTILPLVLKGNAKFALLGEPAVTNLINKAASQNKTVYRLFDLQQLWQQVTESASVGYPQAGLIVKRSLVENKSFAKALYKSLSDNRAFLKDNCDNLNTLMQEAGSSLNVEYTTDLIDRCNLVAVHAVDIKQDIETYLNTFEAMKKYLPLDKTLFYE